MSGERAGVQYAIQIQVNARSASAYWDFDSDFDIHDDEALAWDDVTQAEEDGYSTEDIRVVAITALSRPSDAPDARP